MAGPTPQHFVGNLLNEMGIVAYETDCPSQLLTSFVLAAQMPCEEISRL